MYYRYNEKSKIIEKSETELTGENICISSSDFDLSLYDVIVGHVSESTKQLNYYTKLPRSEMQLIQQIETDRSNIDDLMEYSEELLYQVCLLQLGISDEDLEESEE